jgi:hypothetical protein
VLYFKRVIELTASSASYYTLRKLANVVSVLPVSRKAYTDGLQPDEEFSSDISTRHGTTYVEETRYRSCASLPSFKPCPTLHLSSFLSVFLLHSDSSHDSERLGYCHDRQTRFHEYCSHCGVCGTLRRPKGNSEDDIVSTDNKVGNSVMGCAGPCTATSGAPLLAESGWR